ncbi:MAG: hypothetical protein PHZ19_08675 [Candidatus Thermoplasmatota archaeon]|nr:hypothetical protein [Candidatus Thermoplasmatota archaeon]
MSLNYAAQKLRMAVTILATLPERLDERLLQVYNESGFMGVHERVFPSEEWQAELKQVRDKLQSFYRDGLPDVNDQVHLATRILNLYHEVRRLQEESRLKPYLAPES